MFFEKVLHKIKARVGTLGSIYFGRPRFGHTTEINVITFQNLNARA